MESSALRDLFLILLAASIGGVISKMLKLQPLIGYILAGVTFGSFLTSRAQIPLQLAEIGVILLLFSIGLELSLNRLSRIYKISIVGGALQVVVTSGLVFLLLRVFAFDRIPALVLALGFSLSSTAVVVKMLSDKGEMDTIHGEIMLGWLLFQDLAVIPMLIILPSISGSGDLWSGALLSVIKAGIVILLVYVMGGKIVPRLIHKVAELNSRELMVITSVVVALGTAYFTSLLGVSAALGAFLAGVVISETQENHAVFSETRSLRDIFVALFFVTLGFLVDPIVLIDNFGFIIIFTLILLVIKFSIFFTLSAIFSYHGKTSLQASLGLSQVGEFAFVVTTLAMGRGMISETQASIGVTVAIITLLLTPFLYNLAVPLWRLLKNRSEKGSLLYKYIHGADKQDQIDPKNAENKVVICGFGRVGKWIGKALSDLGISYVVIDYNYKVVNSAKNEGVNIIYGDPVDMDVLNEAGIASADILVIAIPDRVAQEELVNVAQSANSKIKIIVRTHFDDEWNRMKFLRVDKIVQPEFEASIAMTKSILYTLGKNKQEIESRIKSLRQIKAKS